MTVSNGNFVLVSFIIWGFCIGLVQIGKRGHWIKQLRGQVKKPLATKKIVWKHSKYSVKLFTYSLKEKPGETILNIIRNYLLCLKCKNLHTVVTKKLISRCCL